MTVTAVLPARGGSKGLPGKNLMMFDGETLLARCIRVAMRSQTITRLIVSSDCPKILQEAERCGAEPLIRPENISDGAVCADEAVLHAVNTLTPTAKIAIRLNCTAPFTTTADIDNCVWATEETGKSSIAVVDAGDFLLNMHGELVNYPWPLNRQDMEPQYKIAGTVLVGMVETLRRIHGVLDFDSPGYRPIPVPSEFPWKCEIDDENDVRLANALLPLTKAA